MCRDQGPFSQRAIPMEIIPTHPLQEMDRAKKELVRFWLLASWQSLTAARLLAKANPPIWNVATYHCHQAAEKALKGFLVYCDCPPEETQLLRLLLEKAAEIEPCILTWEDAADRLTPYETAYCYPGPVQEPEVEELDEALDDAACIVDQVLAWLPAEVHPDSTA
jgi:HEPN domain-containing protein